VETNDQSSTSLFHVPTVQRFKQYADRFPGNTRRNYRKFYDFGPPSGKTKTAIVGNTAISYDPADSASSQTDAPHTGVAGMDSSRSGLLSTLLMTLPLIVVPAMALLRPPGADSTVSTQNLAADDAGESTNPADDLGFPNDFAGKPSAETPENPDDLDVDAIFGTTEKPDPNGPVRSPPDSSTPPSNEDSKQTASPDPFQSIDQPDKHQSQTATQPTTPSASPAAPAESPDLTAPKPEATQRLVQQLNALGCIRTLWFDAGEKTPVGFAAFFRGQTELTVYRFEAVGQSRAECADNVLRQVTEWRRHSASNP
jgi:hypothetical protein